MNPDAGGSGQGSIANAALMGGAVTTVLSATPYLNNLHACCCILVVSGGLLAAWLLQSDAGGMAGTGRCGAAGAFSGLIGGLLGVPLGAIVSRIAFGAGGLEQQLAEQMAAAREMMQGSGSMPPGATEMAESVLRSTLGLEFGAMTLVVAVFTGVVFSFFGLLGGLLGGVLMNRRAALPPRPGLPSGGMEPPAFRPMSGGPPPVPRQAESPPSSDAAGADGPQSGGIAQPAWGEAPEPDADEADEDQGALSQDELPLIPAAPPEKDREPARDGEAAPEPEPEPGPALEVEPPRPRGDEPGDDPRT